MKTTTTVSLRTSRKNRKANLRRGILAASIGAFLGLAVTASAQQFFDTNGVTAGLGINGGSTNWDTVTANWGTASGTTAGVVWANTVTSDAVFAGTAGTVVQANVAITVRNVTFNTTGYQINSFATPMTFAAGATITVTNAGDSATITSNTSGTSGLVIAGPGTLNFNGFGSNSYTGTTTVNGGTLNLNKGISDSTIPGNLTINAATVNLQQSNQIANTSVVTVNNAGGIFAIGAQSDTVGGVTLLAGGSITGTTGVLTSTSAFDLQSGTVSAILSGAVALNKTTSGTVTLSKANTYTGATNVLEGTLNLTGANALATGTVLNLGKTDGSGNPVVNLNGNNQSVSAINIVAQNGVNASIGLGGGTLTLTGNVSLTSNTASPGIGSSVNIGGFVATAGFLDLGGATRTFNLEGQGRLNQTGDMQIGAVIQNGGITLNQTAAGAAGDPADLFLLNANTYLGQTTVNSGVLQVANNGALGGVGGAGTLVNSGGTLRLGTSFGGGGISVATEALTIHGAGATVAGGGTLGALSTNGSSDTYGGAITAATDATISANGGTLTLTGGISNSGVKLTLGGLTASNAFGTINVNSVISGAAANSDLIVESVTTNLNAANTYNGQTFIRSTALAGSGILKANVAGALPDPNLGAAARTAVIMDDSGLGGSTLNIAAASQVVASLTSAASSKVVLGSNTLTIGAASGTTTFAGVISGNGGIFKDGASTQILTGNNTYFGQTRVNQGTLQIGDGATAGSSIAASVPVIVDGGATLAVNLVTGGTFTNDVTNIGTVLSMAGTVGTGISQTFSGKIDGGGNFVANAGGTTILANINGYQTGTTVSNGSTLQVGTTTAAATAGQNIATNTITLGSAGGGGTLDLVNVNGGILANNITGAGGAAIISVVSDTGSNTTNTLTGQITDGAGRIQVAAVSATGTLVLANANNAFTGSVGATTNGTLQIGTTTTVGSVGTNTNAVFVGNGGTVVLVNIGTAANNTLVNNIDNFAGTGTFQVNSANTNTLSGVISNSAGTLNFVQSGTGKTILTGANTYSGTTTISGGTLQIGNGGFTQGNLGTGDVTNNAILTFNLNNNATVANNISGTGVLNTVGGGVITLGGANTYTGATNVLAGELKLGSAGALGSAGSFSAVVTVSSNAALDLNGFSPTAVSPLNLNGNGFGVAGEGALTNTGAATSTYTGPVTLQTNSGIGSNNGGITLTNTISGGGGVTLTKVGTDTLTLNAANIYNGATQIDGGILVAANNLALGDTAAGTTVATGASLLLANGVVIPLEALNINGAGTGAAAPGALTVAAGGTATYRGAITAQTSSTINANGGTLTLTGGIDKSGVNLTLAGTAAGGTINIRTAGITGAVANSDLIVESTTVNEDVANSYNGQTFIRSTNGAGLGVLNAGVANALPTANGRSAVTMDDSGLGSSVLNIAGTALNPTGASQSIASLTGAASSSVTLGTNTLTIGTAAGTTTFAGVISDTQPAATANVSIIKDGASTQTLSGVNTYKGITRIDAGTLALSGAGSISQSSKVNVANAVGTFDISQATAPGTAIISLAGVVNSTVSLGANTLTLSNANDTFAGVIQDGGIAGGTGGGLTLTTGSETLTGVNTYTGQTTINGGTLFLSGAGSISPSSRVNVANAAGTFDIAATNAPGTTITSLAGVANSKVNLGVNRTLVLSNAADTFAGNIQGTGTSGLTLTAGNETLSGTNTYTGTTTINGGTLTVAGGAAILNPSIVTPMGGAVVINGTGTLNLTSNEVIGTLTGVATSNVTLNANTLTLGVLGVSGGNTTFAGTVSGVGGSIIKNSADTFTLSGGNTYAGTTTVNGGILRAANAAALGTVAGNTTVTSGASLMVANGTAIGLEPLTINGTGSGGIGALTQDAGGLSSFAGPITVATNSTISSNGAGLFNLSGSINKAGVNLTFTGGGTISVTGSITGNTGAFNSDLLVTGVTTNLGNANTYLGPTFITSNNVGGGNGILNANFPNALPTANGRTAVTMDATGTGGSTLGLGASQSIASLQSADVTSKVNLAGNVLTVGFGTAPNVFGTANANFAGVISGTGGLTKDGTSTQILSGASTYTGTTTVTSGVLAVGSTKGLGNANLTLNGGLIRTNGTPLVVNIGGGNVQFNGGIYQASVGGTLPGVNHDQLKTTGTFAAPGGTLALVRQNGYLLAPGDKVNLAIATGGVAGGSVNGTAVPNSSITGLAAFSITPLLIPTVNLYPTTVTLEAMQGSFTALAPTLGFTPNQIVTAKALDSVAAKNLFKTGVVKELSYLDTQPLSTLRSNLDKIAPEELTSIFQIGVSLANVNSSNLTRHMEDIRSGNGGGSAMPSVPSGNYTRYAGGANGPVGRRSKEITPPSDDKWGAFLTGSGEFTHIGGTTNAAGYNLTTGGITAGVDYRVNQNFAVGLSMGYANTSASLANGGSLDADGGRLGLYATYFDQDFHVDASVTGGLNSYKSRRVTPNNTVATGSPDGSEINVLISAGYDWKFGGLTVGPTASYQYTNISMDGFTESGAFAPLRISGQTFDSSRTALGFRAFYDAHVHGATIRPELRLAWQHEFGNTSYSVTSNFAALGGSGFTVSGPTVGRDSLLASAGFLILWSDRFATYVYYDGQFGGQNLESHNVSGGFRLQF